MQKVSVAIVGAGPYGLSIAAHLDALGVSYRIFGKPMNAWAAFMPKGMDLKSEGRASSLYDPQGFTLEKFCQENGLPYKDYGWSIPCDLFVDYGCEFQKRCVSQIDSCEVQCVEKADDGYMVSTDSGEMVWAEKVILASGIAPFAHIPSPLSDLDSVTHSADHHDLSGFKGKRVAVVGRGASAIDLAVLLYEAGAKPMLVTRSASVAFLPPPSDAPRTKLQELRDPPSCMHGLKGYMYEKFPGGFKRLPKEARYQIVKDFAGPAGGWTTKDKFDQCVPVYLNREVVGAQERDGEVKLELAGPEGAKEQVVTDQVIAATGYKVDVKRLSYLCTAVRGEVANDNGIPALSSTFETSKKNLFIVGPATAPIFGPVMRFACGAKFTAQRILKRVA